ncbi:hypothetical protein QFZ67_005353 [Streptomyces sp. V1I1]|nr:hypothetical protein [Streptomyces sp. V1I1]
MSAPSSSPRPPASPATRSPSPAPSSLRSPTSPSSDGPEPPRPPTGRPFKSDANGGFTAHLKVNDKATTGIVAYEGVAWSTEKGAGPAAYTVIDDTPLPGNSQKLNSSVAAGTLSMSQAGDTVALSAVDFGTGGASTGDLKTVTVKDFRGGPRAGP